MNTELIDYVHGIMKYFFIAGLFCAVAIFTIIIVILVFYLRNERRLKNIENKKDK